MPFSARRRVPEPTEAAVEVEADREAPPPRPARARCRRRRSPRRARARAARAPARSSASITLALRRYSQTRVVVLAAEALARPRPRSPRWSIGPHARRASFVERQVARRRRRAAGSAPRCAARWRGGCGAGAARNAEHRARQRRRVLARHHRHVVPRRSPPSSTPPGLSVETTGVPQAERLQRDRRRRLQLGREHEQVGGGLRGARPRRSATRPRKRTASSRPRRVACALSAASCSPVPAIRRRASGRSRRTSAIASSSVAWSASGCSRFTLRRSGPVAGAVAAPRTRARSALGQRHGSRPPPAGTRPTPRGQRHRPAPARALQQRLAVERDVLRLAVHARGSARPCRRGARSRCRSA